MTSTPHASAGLLAGNMTIRRFRVMATPPLDYRELYEKAIRAHALVPLNPERSEEMAVGWCSMHDNDKVDLTFNDFYREGRIVLSLRIDTLRADPSEVKRRLRLRQREIESQRKEPLSNSALRELSDMIKIDLRRQATPKTKTFDLMWDLDGQRLYFFSHNAAANNAMLRLFSETFNLGLDVENQGFWAQQLAASSVAITRGLQKVVPANELSGGFRGLRPCPLASEVEAVQASRAPKKDATEEEIDPAETSTREQLEDRRFLGREFLTWLIYTVDRKDVAGVFSGNPDCEPFEVWLGDKVVLRGWGSGNEITARGASPTQTSDVRYAIAGGMTVREMVMGFKRGDWLWMATISAEGFDLRQVKLPSLMNDDEDDDARLLERFELLDQLVGMIRAAFEKFLTVRLLDAWQSEELRHLKDWLAGSILDDQQYRYYSTFVSSSVTLTITQPANQQPKVYTAERGVGGKEQG